ncbi:hypothetical protein DCO49_02075 [Stenotrophomonas sp. SPM]|nr:hypothetical protein DCO49_02075 [Stenotrophomonas sp. SPM]
MRVVVDHCQQRLRVDTCTERRLFITEECNKSFLEQLLSGNTGTSGRICNTQAEGAVEEVREQQFSLCVRPVGIPKFARQVVHELLQENGRHGRPLIPR